MQPTLSFAPGRPLGRALLLDASTMLQEAALDPYSLLRDVYLQRRQAQIDDMVDRGLGIGVE